MEIAKFDQMRNDMSWSLYAGADKFIRWGGYDDSFWWDKIAPTEKWRVKVGPVTGRIFTLNPDTNEVTIGEPTVAS